MEETIKIKTKDLSFSYNGKAILNNSCMDFQENRITAIVGPSGSGKSTFLKILNRLWETTPGCTMCGQVRIRFAGSFHDIYQEQYPVNQLRRQVGMVFQAANPLPMSIYKNVAFPLELTGKNDREVIRAQVEDSLKMAGLWQEVHDRLDSSAFELSGGQQQRLCIARAMVLQPEVLLLDEPTSSLDHEAAEGIEGLLLKLKKQCTILVVSHYLDQVQRIGDVVVELREGKLVPHDLSYTA